MAIIGFLLIAPCNLSKVICYKLSFHRPCSCSLNTIIWHDLLLIENALNYNISKFTLPGVVSILLRLFFTFYLHVSSIKFYSCTPSPVTSWPDFYFKSLVFSKKFKIFFYVSLLWRSMHLNTLPPIMAVEVALYMDNITITR